MINENEKHYITLYNEGLNKHAWIYKNEKDDSYSLYRQRDGGDFDKFKFNADEIRGVIDNYRMNKFYYRRD